MGVNYSDSQTGSAASQRGTDKDNYKEATKGGGGNPPSSEATVKSPGGLQSDPVYGRKPSMSTEGGLCPGFEGEVEGDGGAIDMHIMEPVDYDWPGNDQGRNLERVGPKVKGA